MTDHHTPAWMQAQLTRLLADPHVCLCDVSGEYCVIVGGKGCELCEKAAALRGRHVTEQELEAAFALYADEVGIAPASGLLAAICSKGLRAVIERERGVEARRKPVAKREQEPAAVTALALARSTWGV